MPITLELASLAESGAGIVPAALGQMEIGGSPESEAWYMARGALITVAVLIIIWLLDRIRLKNQVIKAYQRPFESAESAQKFEELKTNSEGKERFRLYAGIVLLFASIVTVAVPFYNVATAALVIALNWKTGSWPRKYSLITFCVAAVVTSIFAGFELASELDAQPSVAEEELSSDGGESYALQN